MGDSVSCSDGIQIPREKLTGQGQQAPREHTKDGEFRRKASAFRNFISSDPDAEFPAEKGRYALYMNYGCPWAHRTVLVRALKGLDDIIDLIPMGFDMTKDGWVFTGEHGSLEKDPLYGFTTLKQLYLKANPDYDGRYLVPTLWDKKKQTIVSNESSEIIRMFYTEFDDLLPEQDREVNKKGGGFYPEHLRKDIDEMNEWVYNTVNNGVYKCGFAMSQEAHETNLYPLFSSLDRLEEHLRVRNAQNDDDDDVDVNESAITISPFLFGKYITEADIRLFTTLIRFDVAYHSIFQCNLKTIRHDYPRLYLWLRRLYWDDGPRTKNGAFRKTTNFKVYRSGYAKAKARVMLDGNEELLKRLVYPVGPAVDIDELKPEERI